MIIGKWEAKQMLTTARQLCGHLLMGPINVWDQSNARMSAPHSPPLKIKTLAF
jgi:hypothetical protein